MGCQNSESLKPISSKVDWDRGGRSILAEYMVQKGTVGKGAFGEVRRATQIKSGKTCAIKIIKKSGLKSQLLKIETEIGILSNLDHPNIVKVYDFYQSQGHFYIVTELCLGGQLYDHVLAGEQFSQNELRIVLKELLYAVSYLHSCGIAHRDIKPENILFQTRERETTLKLIDFGVSTVGRKVMRQKVGTPYYMAPEIIRGEYTTKCDIWSCGVVMYLLIAGHPPFLGCNEQEIYSLISEGAINFSTPAFKAVSAQCLEVLKALLVHDYQKRPSAGQVLRYAWFSQTKIKGNKTPKQVLAKLHKYKELSMLQKAAVLFVAKRVGGQWQQLRGQFQRLDVNKDGLLSKGQLLASYRIVNPLVTEEEIEALLSSIDLDHSGTVDFSEFMAAAISQQNLISQQQLAQAFHLADKAGKGLVPLAQFKASLLCQRVAPTQIDQAIELADLNSDGFISFQQFKALLIGI